MESEENTAINEARIRQVLYDWAKAVRAKDLNALMSFYAPEIVSYDMIPPLRYEGGEAYRKSWEAGFEMCRTFEMEIRDLNISASDDVAFSFSLNHMTGTDNNGEKFDVWVRWTTCFRRINGRWLIVHEHISVPLDMESGMALQDLTP